MVKSRVVLVIGIVLVAALARLVPHIPNVWPVDALALFGGAYLADRRLAFAVPLAAMMLSDTILGFDGLGTELAVYGCAAATVGLGIWVGRNRSALRIGSAAVAASLLSFVVTDLAVWAFGTLYPHTFAGLVACYVAAIPFLRNILAGDLAYTALLFGGFALLERNLPQIRESLAVAR
ncbi:MAG: hypothetical protein KGO48_18385 [Alphaproteobacteria bacterium]|nr:hypothetical protein [Alphaproteobacteria bacterium]